MKIITPFKLLLFKCQALDCKEKASRTILCDEQLGLFCDTHYRWVLTKVNEELIKEGVLKK